MDWAALRAAGRVGARPPPAGRGVTVAASRQAPSNCVLIHPRGCRLRDYGGQGWIRTTEGVSQQIYSLPRLAAPEPTQFTVTRRWRRKQYSNGPGSGRKGKCVRPPGIARGELGSWREAQKTACGRRWREACDFPGTRASKPAWPVASRWQARSPVGHKQLGDAVFPRRAKFRGSHGGFGDPAGLWPPGPPSERGGVPLQDARRKAGLRMDLPLASSKAGGLGSPRSRKLPADNHSSPRRRGAATGRPTGDRGQGTGDRRQETGDRGQGTGGRSQDIGNTFRSRHG